MTTDAKIRRTFKEELSDLTIIIIAQRIASIEDSDKIIVLHEGEVEAFGNHETLMSVSPIYNEIYESQQKGVLS